MFLQALNAALRILVFRAGPQDFPYSPQLTQAVVTLAVVANYLVFVQLLPPALNLVTGLATAGSMALVMRGVLRNRGLESRSNQALNAWLLCSALLTLLMAIPFNQIGPPLMEQIKANPQLVSNPEAVKIAAGPALMIDLLFIWGFAMSVHIFRNAANVGIGVGLLITLFAANAVFFGILLSSSLMRALGLGVAAH